MAGGILAELEGRAIQQVGGLLEAAAIALDALDFAAARTAYQQVLQIDSDNLAATDGLAMVTALDGIGAEARALHALEAAGELDQAMVALEALLVEHPKNLYLLNERRSIETQQQARALQAALARADQFEAAGDWLAAISSLQEAILLRPSPELNERLAALQKKAKAARLETLLDEGYNALKAGSYDSARKSYREAVDLAPQSKEARTGLEKASSLYLANIRYTQNISSAAKYLIEGRYPLVAKFFNDAMASRPSTLPPSKVEEESRIRSELALQSKEVSLQITSNKKTYVSLIGVFAPERFKSKDLNLFPDVYKVRGTRKGYRTVEFDLKLNSASAKVLEVICTEKL
jgi:tetratricopeptide (TPR) repeat protein